MRCSDTDAPPPDDAEKGFAAGLLRGFEDDDRGDGIERLGGELDVERVAGLGELQRLVRGVGEEVRLRDLARQLVEMERTRSEEHTSELQSRQYLVCRLLLEK